MKIAKPFLLSWRKIWIITVGGFASIILHNLFSELWGTEEALFFSIVVFVIPLYLLISILFTVIYMVKKNKARKK